MLSDFWNEFQNLRFCELVKWWLTSPFLSETSKLAFLAMARNVKAESSKFHVSIKQLFPMILTSFCRKTHQDGFIIGVTSTRW